METPERLYSLSAFDRDQIKTNPPPQLLVVFKKWCCERKQKAVIKQEGGRSLIFLAAPTGSAKREQGKMEKKEKAEMYYSTSVMTINI